MAGRLRNPRHTVRGAISITCGYVPASIVPFPFPPHTPTSFCHKRHPLRHKRQPLHFFAINGSLRSRAPQTAASAAERCKRRSPHLQKILIGRLTKKREQPPQVPAHEEGRKGCVATFPFWVLLVVGRRDFHCPAALVADPMGRTQHVVFDPLLDENRLRGENGQSFTMFPSCSFAMLPAALAMALSLIRAAGECLPARIPYVPRFLEATVTAPD